MVALFAAVLKKEAGKHFLVTPVEKVGIEVEDCPFLVTEMEVAKVDNRQLLTFHTNVGDIVVANANHPLSVTEQGANQAPHPTLHIRGGLQGLLTRAVFYRLVELAEKVCIDGIEQFGLYSDGEFFSLGKA